MEQKNRVEGKNSSLNDSRLERLQNIGFRWAKRKGQASWEEKYVSSSSRILSPIQAYMAYMSIATLTAYLFFHFSHFLVVSFLSRRALRMNFLNIKPGMATVMSLPSTRITPP